MNRQTTYIILSIILLIIVLLPLEIYADTGKIVVKGKAFRTLDFYKPKRLDVNKVKVTSISNGKFLIFENKYQIDKQSILDLTSVKNDVNSKSSYQVINLITDNGYLTAVIKSELQASLTLRVSDLNGRIIQYEIANVNEGINYVYFPQSVLTDGCYMIDIMTSSASLFKTGFILNGGVCSTKHNFNHDFNNFYSGLKSVDGYEFIGYTDSEYKPDTVVVESISELDTLNFEFLDKGNFQFRTGTFTLTNITLNTTKVEYVYDSDGKVKDTLYTENTDIQTLDYSLIPNEMTFSQSMSCDDVVNSDNNILFCYLSGDNNPYKFEINRTAAFFVIDTVNQTLYIINAEYKVSLSYSEFQDPESSGTRTYDDIITRFLSSKPYPYIIDEQTGQLTVITDDFKKEDVSFTYSLTRKNYPAKPYKDKDKSLESITLKSYEVIPNITSLIIVLNP